MGRHFPQRRRAGRDDPVVRGTIHSVGGVRHDGRRDVHAEGGEPVKSGVADAYALARQAYSSPEVRFLSEKQHGVFILALFTSAFSREHPVAPDGEFHEYIDHALDVLRDLGETDLPSASGRSLCLMWMQDGWIDKELALDGRAVYRPSAAAQTVLDWLASQSRRRMVSAPRINRILDTVADLAALVDPDRDALIREKRAKAEQLLREAADLETGGAVPQGTDDELVQLASLVAEAMGEIPSDFRRVGQQFTAAQRRIREQMLTGSTTAGEVMSSVTSSARQITNDTVEGRAFMGVAELIRDDATIGALRSNVVRIMTSPVAALFTETERVMFANIATAFVSNVDLVLQGPRALSQLVAGRLASHVTAPAGRGGLDESIRAARAALLARPGPLPEAAMPTLGPVRVPGSSLRLHDPRPVDAPRPLAEAPASTAQPLTVEYLRRWGGPHGQAVADHVAGLLAAGRNRITLAEAWQVAPADLRRSVELLGYFAHTTRSESRSSATDVIRVTEGEGSRTFRVPRIWFVVEKEGEL